MPRINSAKNFAGVSYVTTKQMTSFTVETAADSAAIITALASTSAIVGNLVLVNGGAAKGTYVVTALGSNGKASAVSKLSADASVTNDITALQNAIKIDGSGTENAIGEAVVALQDAIKIDGSGTQDGIGQAVYSIVDVTAVANGQDTYKIKASVLPDLAITKVYTLEVTSSNYTAGTTTLDTLVKTAITPEAGVQRGDVVILTSADKTIAEAVAGTYIFTADVADKNNVASSGSSKNYVKMYAPAGTVTSVNSVAPVAGNVTINLANVGNVTGATSLSYASGRASVNGTALANESEITTINTTIGAASSGNTAATGIFARLEAIEEAIGSGEGDSIATQLASEISARSEDDAALKTAVDQAIGLTPIVKTITGTGAGSYLTGTKAGANQVVTISDITTAGVVVAVLNASGEQVYPTITYDNSGVPTLTADYEDGDVDAKWTIYQTKAITATLTHTVSAGD